MLKLSFDQLQSIHQYEVRTLGIRLARRAQDSRGDFITYRTVLASIVLINGGPSHIRIRW